MSTDTRSLASTKHYGEELPCAVPVPQLSPPLQPLMPLVKAANTLLVLRVVIRQHDEAQAAWRMPDPDDAADSRAREGLLRKTLLLRDLRDRLTADFIEQAADALGLQP